MTAAGYVSDLSGYFYPCFLIYFPCWCSAVVLPLLFYYYECLLVLVAVKVTAGVLFALAFLIAVRVNDLVKRLCGRDAFGSLMVGFVTVATVGLYAGLWFLKMRLG